MAGRNRISRMFSLLDKKDGNTSTDSFSDQTQLSLDELLVNSPKPGCSKDGYSHEETVHDYLEISPEPDNFTDADVTFLICFDIMSTLIDSLPCFDKDYSSGSSDDYIPDSEECAESEDDMVTSRRQISSNRQNVVIVESESEDNLSFWEKEGVKEGRKRKPRKSEKERRKDRENRKKKRNLGKSYETKKGKIVKEREFKKLVNCRLKCAVNIPEEFRKEMFEAYWKLGDYNHRVQYISNLIELKNKKTGKLIVKKNNRQYANNYYLKKTTESYRICKGCFLKTFDETPKFVQLVTDKLKVSEGLVPNSPRGNNPSAIKISDERLEGVKQHILSFPAYESHYGRSKTTKKFLPPHLCLTDMYNAYRDVTENPVSQTIYNWVFKGQNLSFKKPYVDTCVKCDTLEMQIKFSEGEQKLANESLKAEHLKRAETIYDRKAMDRALSLEKSDTFVASFDLQQCLPTPYLKSGAAFYKRQLWTFNLTIRNCTTNKPYCFMWHEGIGGRGANQIASCVYNYILNYVPDGIKHLIFYSDSCSGQNKNIHMVCMFLLAVRNHPSVETITHNFFVPGHTHMDCDVDHALIEKAKKKTQMDIHHPRDWYQLVRTCGKKQYFTVIEMETEQFLDFASLLKGPLIQKKVDEDKNKFSISETAIFRYNREEFPKFQYQGYESEHWNTVSLLRRRGKSPMPCSVFETANIARCYDGPIPISKEKKSDLMSLLPLINPSVRSFYVNLLTSDDVIDSHPLEPVDNTLE